MASVTAEVAEGEKKRTGPEYFYDLSNRQLLLGKVAVETHTQIAELPTEVYPLRELLRQDIGELPPFKWEPKPKRRKSELLKYGRWLCEVVGEPDDKKQRKLNEFIIHRAGRLGIGPTVHEITKHPAFGTLSRYYMELGLSGVKKAGLFDDWSLDDYKNFLVELEAELGRKPQRDDIINKNHAAPDCPPLSVILRRLGRLSNLYALNGRPSAFSATKDDCLGWGVRFMKANGGRLPTQFQIDYLSTKDLSVSATKVAKLFNGSLNIYKAELAEMYHTMLANEENVLKQIKDFAASEECPSEIYKGVRSRPKRLMRVSKYMVLEEIFPERHPIRKISIATEGTETVKKDGFLVSTRKLNSALSAGDIENAALYLGVYDFIWLPDSRYLRQLKIT